MKYFNLSTKIVVRTIVAAGLIAGLAACSFPKRDAKPMPDVSVIKVIKDGDNFIAVPPECLPLFTEYSRWDFDSRPQYPFGCATYHNLAKSIANPRDLVHPSSYAGQQADTAAQAVTRYRDNDVTKLNETDTTKK